MDVPSPGHASRRKRHENRRITTKISMQLGA
jgi:hypothetical protein